MRRRTFLSTVGLGASGAVLPGGAAHAAIGSGLTDGSLAGAALRPVPARMADKLCSNYMVNTKLFYASQVYGHTEAVVDLLTELGVRTIRERVTTGSSTGTKKQLRAMPRLASRGIRWHGTVAKLEDWERAPRANKEVMDFLSTMYGSDLTTLMHSFGGCNEIDGPVLHGERDPKWALHGRMMQRALWEQAKLNPRTRDIPVAGPSTRTDFDRTRAARLGDLSPWSELGNGHLYNKGTSPSREIDEHLRILDPCFPGLRRYIFTETGYNNSPADNLGKPVPEFASAIYAVRGICDFFKRGAMYGRFELLDDPNKINYTSQATINQTAVRDAHFGLVAMTKHSVRESTPDTWRKKPEFYATRNLLGLLSDRGAAFTPKPLAMSVTGGGPDMRQLLLQKRDGRHYLVLWRDVQVSDLYPDPDPIAVAPVRINVRLATARPVAVFKPTQSAKRVGTRARSTSFTFNLRGALKVIEIG